MANNYCEFSSYLNIPNCDKEKVERLIKDAIIPIKLSDGWVGCEYIVEDKGVWFTSIDANGSPEHVEIIARYLMQNLNILDSFMCSFSFYCDKLRLDEFGGGCFIIEIDQPTIWIDPVYEATKILKKRRAKIAKERKII